MPPVDSMRRIYEFTEAPRLSARTPDAARIIAHHEAGHVVLAEWCGLTVTEATAQATGGAVSFDLDALLDDPDMPPDTSDRSALAACHIASLYHAGYVAELLLAGKPWTGIVARMGSSDWKNASRALAPYFGAGLAGHGYAQRIAMHVLTTHWRRVEYLANRLLEHGLWSPENAPPMAA